MKRVFNIGWVILISAAWFSCGKKGGSEPPPNPPPTPANFNISSWSVSGLISQPANYGVSRNSVVRFTFPTAINRSTVATNIQFNEANGSPVNYTASYEKGDSIVIITAAQQLSAITRYKVKVADQLKSTNGGRLINSVEFDLITAIDSSRKFPAISDDALLTLVQQQTFKYFWDFGHPVSGLARERNSSGDVVTSGGSGFGIMAIVAGVHRNFVTRAEAVQRLQKIVTFLKNTAQRFHGAYPHWLNGSTGVVVPFSTKDNGADLVETAYLIQGLLTARQYFNGANTEETTLRNDINAIWNAVEWNWFRQGTQNVLYWHWSPDYNWEMNHQVKGWNECLITYVLAASSTTHSIPKIVYENGFAGNGSMKNNNSYYNINLPLGEPYGGPLFFAHYSFLGINPTGLTDAYANYWDHNKNHSLINNQYCINNSKGYYGYSDSCWGLTASDIPGGYTASSPTNDVGVIAPTAALSSFPYTPTESMKALKFFYYVLGNRLWKEYGFVDAFSLHNTWFADSFLAIDQGPIIIMIENYRSGLLWNLFMSCPEVKTGMTNLGFQSPNL